MSGITYASIFSDMKFIIRDKLFQYIIFFKPANDVRKFSTVCLVASLEVREAPDSEWSGEV